MLEDRKRASDYYIRKHKDDFVVIVNQNRDKMMGILRDVTPEGNLYIEGKNQAWSIDPTNILKFFAKPDEGGGGSA